MKKLIVLVGPPGSGKSTECDAYRQFGLPGNNHISPIRISQDDQGRQGHMQLFHDSIQKGFDIVIDRMNFNKEQRNRFLQPAKEAGYEIEIVVFHVPRQTCFERIMSRENHPTINGLLSVYDQKTETITNVNIFDLERKERQANSALDTFFTKYERVEDSEADKVTRLGWVEDTHKTKPAIICDLDGTLCNIDHRLKHVKHEVRKNNRWDLFNKEIPNDGLNVWCDKLIRYMGIHHPIILCSGRVDSTRQDTENWLLKHDIKPVRDYRHLLMRHRNDFRQDYIIKEIILEFEIKTRYQILFSIDDRKQVVDMWRKHGITCLQCAPGDF